MGKQVNKAIIIRADGSKEIGMGHLSRACQISKYYKNIDTTIVMKDDLNGKKFLSSRSINGYYFDSKLSFEEELNLLEKKILKYGYKKTILILDVLDYYNYYIFIKKLKTYSCISLIICDNSEQKNIYSDIVLNGNPLQLNYDYSKSNSINLVGPKYFIMDPEYQKISAKKPTPEVTNVLLTVGGSDHNNLLFKIISALELLKDNYNIKIFTTSSTGYVKDLKYTLDKSSLTYELYFDVNSLAPYWNNIDLAITAGGNTLFERITARVPGITICQLELQMEIADSFHKLGVNVNIGLGINLTEEYIANSLKDFINDYNLRRSQYMKSRKVVDAKGLEYLDEIISKF